MSVKPSIGRSRQRSTACPRSPAALIVAVVLAWPSMASVRADDGDLSVSYAEPSQVCDAAIDVLADPEFRNLPRLELDADGKPIKPSKPKSKESPARQIETPSGGPLAELIASLFGGAVSIAVVIVMAVILAVIVALIVLGLRRWDRAASQAIPRPDDAADDEQDTFQSPGERPADAWLDAARRAAASGRFDEALALLLLGAMSHAERAGLIRSRRGLTYRDYQRAIPESSAWSPTLSQLIRAYAPVGFGRRDATQEVFNAVVGPYEAALAAEPTPGLLAAPAGERTP